MIPSCMTYSRSKVSDLLAVVGKLSNYVSFKGITYTDMSIEKYELPDGNGLDLILI